ncbi:MAG: imidazole glycerol phosphate synthase subunit HisH, partial [Acidobacteria bacterium]|nr:imidazole glycerol phosphate synthase subunit HisH [Acidobacteriota bacterium]
MIVVIDYKAGNLYNVGNALKYLNADFTVSGDPAVVSQADKVILPGVGSARAAMESLTEQGLVEVLQGLRVPFLGICLGFQMAVIDYAR